MTLHSNLKRGLKNGQHQSNSFSTFRELCFQNHITCMKAPATGTRLQDWFRRTGFGRVSHFLPRITRICTNCARSIREDSCYSWLPPSTYNLEPR